MLEIRLPATVPKIHELEIRRRPPLLMSTRSGSAPPASRSVEDPLWCRMRHATDVCTTHPVVLMGVPPTASDRFEWLFAMRHPRTEHDNDDGIIAHLRRAGPGQYVRAVRYLVIKDGEGQVVGYLMRVPVSGGLRGDAEIGGGQSGANGHGRGEAARGRRWRGRCPWAPPPSI
jgi:hypothetical protein